VTTEHPPATLPRITILTPCLNGARYIGDAIASLRRQNYADLEHIVLDAGSTDGTLEILARFPEVRVISEPDRGTHDAMNKGIRRATGEAIGFLNADDIYPDGLLLEVGRMFADDPELAVVVGRTIVFEENGRGERRVLVAREHAREHGFWLPELAFGAPGFNGRFFRRSLFQRIGDFDNDYYIAGDRHFLLRVALAGCKARNIARAGIYYRLHSGSATINAQKRQVDAITREHVRMSREFIDRTSGAQRRIFLAWHAFEGVRLILRTLRAGRPGEALVQLFRLGLRGPLRPLHFARGLALKRAVRQVERRNEATANEALP
jgi:glycosyltransferase involved in cell wall biosynthesis